MSSQTMAVDGREIVERSLVWVFEQTKRELLMQSPLGLKEVDNYIIHDLNRTLFAGWRSRFCQKWIRFHGCRPVVVMTH
jgi:hypothetical protein